MSNVHHIQSEDDEDSVAFFEGDEKTSFLPPRHDEAPKDKCFVAYFLFVLLGIGVLFPWNAFLTAGDYFNDRYTDFPFLFAVSLAYNYPGLVFLILNVKFGPRFSFTSRLVTGFVVVIVVQIITPFIESFGLGTTAAMWVTLGGVFITGCAIAMLFGTVLGLASLFPPQMIGGIMMGNGIAGILAGGLRMITKVSMPEGSHTSIILYFALSGGLLVICILGYFVLLRLPLTQHYLRLQKAATQSTKNPESIQADSLVSGGGEEEDDDKTIHYGRLFLRLWREAAVVFFVFFVTLSLFPSMTGEINTTTSIAQDWFGIFLVFTFQVCDFIGRSLPRFFIVFSERTLWIPSLLRLGFFPLFILCINPVIFDSDGWYYSFMFLFAVTNGYCGTLAMMFGPVNALEHEKETAGIIMSFFLNFGIFVAAHFALLLLYLVTGKTPW